jgi:hypothetical protein
MTVSGQLHFESGHIANILMLNRSFDNLGGDDDLSCPEILLPGLNNMLANQTRSMAQRNRQSLNNRLI